MSWVSRKPKSRSDGEASLGSGATDLFDRRPSLLSRNDQLASAQRLNRRRRVILNSVQHRWSMTRLWTLTAEASRSLASVFRVLIVDDFEPWRRVVRSMLQYFAEWQIVGEASDGVEGVRKTEQLQPDIILLDIGLPKLNGIDAAKPILRVAPHSKIIFLSIELCPEFVQRALRTGVHGYVVKSDAASDL